MQLSSNMIVTSISFAIWHDRKPFIYSRQIYYYSWQISTIGPNLTYMVSKGYIMFIHGMVLLSILRTVLGCKDASFSVHASLIVSLISVISLLKDRMQSIC